MLLLDENLSFKIIRSVETQFPNSLHVRTIGLNNSSDYDIWNYAKANSLAIVTYDADFLNISILRGCPLKIILLKQGNRSKNEIISTLSKNEIEIKDFLTLAEFEKIGCLEIW